jgi:hypothetical protein
VIGPDPVPGDLQLVDVLAHVIQHRRSVGSRGERAAAGR